MFGLKMLSFYHFKEAMTCVLLGFSECNILDLFSYYRNLGKFILAVKLPTHAHIGKGTRNNSKACFDLYKKFSGFREKKGSKTK